LNIGIVFGKEENEAPPLWFLLHHPADSVQLGLNTRVNQKVKAIFKLRGNRDREELAHCAVLTIPVKEFSHLQYSTLSSVEWQQRGRKHGCSLQDCTIEEQRGRRGETCGNSPSYVGSVWTEHLESSKGLRVGGKV
jgi:hypothetical protein